MGKKILVWLEKNVEWFAVVLGGLWLLLMLIDYILGTPVKTTLGSIEATPGSVDRKIVDTSVNALDAQMQVTDPPKMSVPQFAEQFKDAINFNGTRLADIGSPQLLWGTTPGDVGKVKPEQERPVFAKARAVPETPAPTFDALVSGRSVVTPAAPVNPAAPPAAAPAVPVVTSVDVDWVSVSFKVSSAGLQAAFTKAEIPRVLGTTFLGVDLVRQEKKGDTWGDEKVIAPLEINQIPPLPLQGPAPLQVQYEQWAAASVQPILQPPFYPVRPVNGGDAWHEPGIVVPVAAPVAAPAPEPAAPVPTPRVRPGTPRITPGGPGGPGGPTGPGGVPRERPVRPSGRNIPPDAGPIDSARPSSPFAQATPRFPRPVDPNQPFPNMGTLPPNFDPSAFPGAVPGAAPAFALPQGVFNPTALTSDVKVWAHDDSVQPEHTYRYKLRYYIQNPLFQRPQFAANPNLAAPWEVKSADSDWSTPVTVQARSYFFLVGGGANSTARFRIFKWQDGVWKAITDTVAAGDQIGKTDGAVNFGTGWTVVDVRRDPQRPQQNYTLLVNDQGQMVRRTADGDASDPKQKELNDLVNAAAGAPGAAAPGAGTPLAGGRP